MRAIPAVDLREGACVQLVGGSYAQERIRRPDPVNVAREWAQLGFESLHLVDLDAATGRGSNSGLVSQILGEGYATTQVGGGIRDGDVIDRHLAAGANYVVVGTRAIEEPDWLREMCEEFPGVLIVAADVRGRNIVTRGWQRVMTRKVEDTLEELDALALAGILVTAVHCEGQMRGPDLALVEDVIERVSVPLYVSGGIASMRDLESLAECGAAAAVIGMALYTGALDARSVAEEYGT